MTLTVYEEEEEPNNEIKRGREAGTVNKTEKVNGRGRDRERSDIQSRRGMIKRGKEWEGGSGWWEEGGVGRRHVLPDVC